VGILELRTEIEKEVKLEEKMFLTETVGTGERVNISTSARR
jgi:hypothetical protein